MFPGLSQRYAGVVAELDRLIVSGCDDFVNFVKSDVEKISGINDLQGQTLIMTERRLVSWRVVLSDTLLSNFSDEEIEAVVAHELGHYKHKDIVKLMLINSLIIFVGFYLMSKFLNHSVAQFCNGAPVRIASGRPTNWPRRPAVAGKNVLERSWTNL